MTLAVRSQFQGRGCFTREGFPIWTCSSLFVLLGPFWGLSRFFWDFPDLSGDSPGIFQICPFPLSRLLILLKAPTRNSPEKVRDTISTFPEKSGKPRFGNTPVYLLSTNAPPLSRRSYDCFVKGCTISLYLLEAYYFAIKSCDQHSCGRL